MNTTSVYFYAFCALLFVIALLYFLGALRESLARILTPTAICLYLPLVGAAFFAEAELRVLLLTALISAFCYTLPRFIKYLMGRGNRQ